MKFKNTYKCPVCLREFKKLAWLEKHLVRFEPGKTFHFNEQGKNYSQILSFFDSIIDGEENIYFKRAKAAYHKILAKPAYRKQKLLIAKAAYRKILAIVTDQEKEDKLKKTESSN